MIDKQERFTSGFCLCVCVIQGCATGEGNSELEVARQENEALKAQMAQLSAQLLDVSSNTSSFSLIFFCLLVFESITMMIENFISHRWCHKLNERHSEATEKAVRR